VNGTLGHRLRVVNSGGLVRMRQGGMGNSKYRDGLTNWGKGLAEVFVRGTQRKGYTPQVMYRPRACRCTGAGCTVQRDADLCTSEPVRVVFQHDKGGGAPTSLRNADIEGFLGAFTAW